MAGGWRRTLAAAGAAAVIAAVPATACGPFVPQAIFFQTIHPDLPLTAYSSGKLGIVQPSYRVVYLYVAYRLLSGTPFSRAQQRALWARQRSLAAEGPAPPPFASGAAWLRQWEQTTGTALPLTAGGWSGPGGVYRALSQRQGGGPVFFGQFLNCPDAAFHAALRTWSAVRTRYGSASGAARRWMQAQKQVFANCAGGPAIIPARLPPGAAAQARADRAYQIAAAEFYAGEFGGALAGFRAIAANASSPWSGVAPYLAARALLREATLGYSQDQYDTAVWTGSGAGREGYRRERVLLREAVQELDGALHDQRSRRWWPPSRRLRRLALTRLHPRAQLAALARRLMLPGVAHLGRDVRDFTFLFRQAYEYGRVGSGPLARNALLVWIADMRAGTSSYGAALSRWRSSRRVPWLIAALTAAPDGVSGGAALIRAAELVPKDSPGFASARFQALRLELAARRWDSVYRRAAEMARTPQPPSARNAFRAMAFATAPTLRRRWAAMEETPSAFTYNAMGNDNSLALPPSEGPFAPSVRFFFNHTAPLAVWIEAARSPGLRGSLKRQLVLAAWTRAAVLDLPAARGALAVAAERAAPVLAPYLARYRGATGGAARRFAAAWLLLHFPGLRPYLLPRRWGAGRLRPRLEALSTRDVYRNNWWYPGIDANGLGQAWNVLPAFLLPAYGSFGPRAGAGSPQQARGFRLRRPRGLSRAQFALGRAQQQRLAALGAAPDILCGWVLAWARRHPRDARVPRALARAVWATHYGYRDAATGPLSRACYRLLHRRYAGSVWARRTPFWYALGGV